MLKRYLNLLLKHLSKATLRIDFFPYETNSCIRLPQILSEFPTAATTKQLGGVFNRDNMVRLRQFRPTSTSKGLPMRAGYWERDSSRQLRRFFLCRIVEFWTLNSCINSISLCSNALTSNALTNTMARQRHPADSFIFRKHRRGKDSVFHIIANGEVGIILIKMFIPSCWATILD